MESVSAAEAPFSATRPVSAFASKEVLAFSNDGRHAVVLGEVEGAAALLQLDQKAAYGDGGSLVAALPSLEVSLTNYSGAEYSYYDARAPCGAAFSCEVVWPASERQIQRKRPSEVVAVEESAALYARVVAPFAAAQAAHVGWIDKVCALEAERERNLHDSADFVVNVDTKWTTHGAFDGDRAAWVGADWTSGLYLLAIAKDAALTSLRDLRGDAGAALCRAMRDALLDAARRVYGVPKRKVRCFFHYQPQFYRLHAHCATIQHVVPGVECDRAHLLTTVAENLDLAPDYYRNATLTYKVRVGEKLHAALHADGALS